MFSNTLFRKYTEGVISDLEPLTSLALTNCNSWEIDWFSVYGLVKPDVKRDWTVIPEFKKLIEFRDKPAVYYFTVNDGNMEDIFRYFQEAKAISSGKRKLSGLTSDSFFNISHVPKELKPGSCLYVGSRKKDLHGRLIQHLGFGSSGRTGALYMTKVFAALKEMPKITFHYFILEEKFSKLTEHIECVLYDKLDPIIGKRPIRKTS